MPQGLGLVCGRIDSKKRLSRRTESSGGSLSDLYGIFLKKWGILPSELARQDPKLLFMALDTMNSSKDELQIPPGMEFFYGM